MEFDPFSIEFFEDPYGVYAWLLEEAPVYHNDKIGFWALSRYDDCIEAHRDVDVWDPEVRFFSIRDESTIHNAFGVPEAYDPIGAITIGYPDPSTKPPSRSNERKDFDDVVRWGRWST